MGFSLSSPTSGIGTMLRLACIAVALIATPLVANANWYYSCGRWYWIAPPVQRPNITTNNTYNTTNNYSPKTYQELLVELAQYREQYNAAIIKANTDNKNFIDAVAAFGYQQNNYGYQQQSNYGLAGQTQYGYSAQTILQSYGQNDIGQLYLQASQLTRGAQQLAGQANTEFTGLVSQAGNNQARIAEILARAEGAKRVLDALEMPRATLTNNVRSWGTSPANGGPNGQPDQALAQVLQNKCASCHNGQNRSGGFAASDYFNLSPEDKGYVISLLTTNDPNKRMPRIPDGTRLGKPGALFAEEIEMFKR